MRAHRLTFLLALCALVACADPLAIAPPTPPPLPTRLVPEASTAAPAQAARSEPAPTRQPTATPPPPPLELWANAQGSELDALRSIAESWGLQRGRALRLAAFSADGLRAELQVAALQGRAPALLYGDEQDLAAFARAELLQPLDAPLPELLPALDRPALQSGQRMGVPVIARGGLVLYYNRRLIPTPPATTDELIVRAGELTGGDGYGLVYNWPDARWLLPWVTGLGGAPLAPDGVTPQLDSPQLGQALALLQELRGAGPPPPVTYEQATALFRNGSAAMAIDGDWNYATYRGAPPDLLDLGVAALPLLPASGRLAPPGLGAAYLMAHRTLPAADLADARDFASYLLAPDSQRRLAASGHLPALLSALDDPAVQGNELLAALARAARESPPPPVTAADRCAYRAISNNLPPLLLGERDRPATQQAMQESARACIASQ
jgi:arabinogalactan oligomer / maltooligosaccharide transport system substrate-binding protein